MGCRVLGGFGATMGAEVDVGPMLERYSDLLMDKVLKKLLAAKQVQQ